MVLAFVAADGALGPELLVADVAGEVLDLQVDAVLVGLEKRRILEEQGPDFVWNFSPIQLRLELMKISNAQSLELSLLKSSQAISETPQKQLNEAKKLVTGKCGAVGET